jgi:guanine nucleotide-binding protein subunit alpha
MKYAHTSWSQERGSWRAVIQLNLIRSIIAIVETLQAEMDNEPITSRPMSPVELNSDALLRRSLDITPSEIEAASQPLSIPLTAKHHLLKRRLGPLRRVEADLKRRLGSACMEETEGGNAGVMGAGDDRGAVVAKQSMEFGVRGWKDVLGGWAQDSKAVRDGILPVDDATEVISSCKEDMKALWMDQAVKDILEKRRMRIQDSAGL